MITIDDLLFLSVGQCYITRQCAVIKSLTLDELFEVDTMCCIMNDIANNMIMKGEY